MCLSCVVEHLQGDRVAFSALHANGTGGVPCTLLSRGDHMQWPLWNPLCWYWHEGASSCSCMGRCGEIWSDGGSDGPPADAQVSRIFARILGQASLVCAQTHLLKKFRHCFCNVFMLETGHCYLNTSLGMIAWRKTALDIFILPLVMVTWEAWYTGE